MVRANGATFAFDLTHAAKHLGPVDFVNQTEPTLLHPLFEGLQHPIRPYRAFHPLPSGTDFSGLLVPSDTAAGWLSHAMAFTDPPSCLPWLHGHCPLPATMQALTPARPVLRLALQNERRPYNGQASLLHMTRASLRSATNHLTRPITLFCCPPSVMGS